MHGLFELIRVEKLKRGICLLSCTNQLGFKHQQMKRGLSAHEHNEFLYLIALHNLMDRIKLFDQLVQAIKWRFRGRQESELAGPCAYTEALVSQASRQLNTLLRLEPHPLSLQYIAGLAVNQVQIKCLLASHSRDHKCGVAG